MSELKIPDFKACPNLSDFNNICRICLSKENQSSNLQQISVYNDISYPENELNLREKIGMCSDIVVDENEKLLPNKICERCVNLVLIAHYFKVLCNNSDKILREIILNNGQSENDTSIIKEEISENHSDHINLFKNDKVFTCDSCQMSFSKKTLLNRHISSKHLNQKLKRKKTGSVCRKRKANKLKIELEEDMNILTEDLGCDYKTEYYECLICNVSFDFKEDLDKHMFCHDESSKYKCYGCDSVFDKYSERTHHEKYYCPNMPPGTKYECSKCKEKCDNRFRYDTHLKYGCGNKYFRSDLKTIELKPLLKCPHCDLTTMNKSTLRNHILNCHTEDKPYICEVCGKGYAMVSSLNNHRKQSHTTEKKYKCSFCPYAARQQSSLNVHIRRHTLEYRYSCEICGASFKQNTAYHVHMRRYHKEKEFQCEICKKMFSEKAEMKQHVSSVHLGLKPHECKDCGAAFCKKRSLKAHLVRVHNIPVTTNILYQKAVHVVNV